MLYDQESPAMSTESHHNGQPVLQPSGGHTGFPLIMARSGDLLIVRAMHGGRNFRRQLMDMGLRPGSRIQLLRAGGPVLVQVGETRIGIGRGMAEKIEVVPAGKDGDE